MSDLVQRMHDEVEVIWDSPVDHVHADMLHRYIDQQAEKMAMQAAQLRRVQIMLAASRTILIYHNILPEDNEL